jgi:hypothetical protein
VAVCRLSAESQRRGVEASWVRVVLLREAIRGVAAWMDVEAYGVNWSWVVPPEYGWMRGVESVPAARDWLAVTSSHSIKGAVRWHTGGENYKQKKEHRNVLEAYSL